MGKFESESDWRLRDIPGHGFRKEGNLEICNVLFMEGSASAYLKKLFAEVA